jgi:hypothetical protein
MNSPLAASLIASLVRWLAALIVGGLVTAKLILPGQAAGVTEQVVGLLGLIASGAVSLGWSYLTQRKLLSAEPPQSPAEFKP